MDSQQSPTKGNSGRIQVQSEVSASMWIVHEQDNYLNNNAGKNTDRGHGKCKSAATWTENPD